MKKLLPLLFTIIILVIPDRIISQKSYGGKNPRDIQETACLSSEQRKSIFDLLSKSRASLKKTNKYHTIKANQTVQFIWPVEQAAGFDYNSTWAISNYVDHDSATNSLSDYNCGSRTYDTTSGYDHKGIDIYTWPFSWQQMEDNQTHIIAAATGQIIYKNDGSYDQNCSFNSSFWNAVYVEHADGSVSWYGHMKSGSLTSKNVGDTVAQGEFLGVIGSSGNSTGPHLHFETYDANNNLIDPYEGPCNDLNEDSWWVDQKEYVNPKINTILTHSAAPEFYNCPGIQDLNIEDQFDPDDLIIFAGYFADQQTGTNAEYSIYTPSGDVFYSWTQNFTSDYYSSYWYRSISVNDEEGQWTFEVSYNGQTVTRTFIVGSVSIPNQTAYTTHTIPGIIEAEDFDNGGEGISYTDTETNNKGKAYRTNEGVDIETTEDTDGEYNVGWINDNEWLEYTISDVQSGSYEISFRIAAKNNISSSIEVTLGNAYLGEIAIPQTGDWQIWDTVTLSGIDLTSGTNDILRLKINGGSFNLNYIEFKAENITSDIPIGKYISLQKGGGDQLYVAAEDANNRLIADRTQIGAWEKFLVEEHPDGGIALKAFANGLYVTVPDLDAQSAVMPRGESKGSQERFEWLSMGDGMVALKSVHSGKWLQASWNENEGIVRARGNNSLTWETFYWKEETVQNSGSGSGGAIKEESESMILYPNPSKKGIYLQIPKITSTSNPTYYIYNSIGNIVKSNTIKETQEIIDISQLAQGVYFLHVQDGKITYQKTFVKQ
ncbi:carbohydrate-binding protein [Aquimarina pacifica]|uniref:carbohydrate-binding protein n=1 Tax=Aquimarina pacifica TaxID=1296415 RepID=UPI00047205D5|nr:carbohydrate-binding protein [Aquimarina pacifica]